MAKQQITKKLVKSKKTVPKPTLVCSKRITRVKRKRRLRNSATNACKLDDKGNSVKSVKSLVITVKKQSDVKELRLFTQNTVPC